MTDYDEKKYLQKWYKKEKCHGLSDEEMQELQRKIANLKQQLEEMQVLEKYLYSKLDERGPDQIEKSEITQRIRFVKKDQKYANEELEVIYSILASNERHVGNPFGFCKRGEFMEDLK